MGSVGKIFVSTVDCAEHRRCSINTGPSEWRSEAGAGRSLPQLPAWDQGSAAEGRGHATPAALSRTSLGPGPGFGFLTGGMAGPLPASWWVPHWPRSLGGHVCALKYRACAHAQACAHVPAVVWRGGATACTAARLGDRLCCPSSWPFWEFVYLEEMEILSHTTPTPSDPLWLRKQEVG